MLKKIFIRVGIFFCALFLIYAIWVVVAMNRVATISVDYIAKVNEVASAVEDKDRAWPIYRQAGIALKKNEMPGSIFFDLDLEEPSWPTQEGWGHIDTWIEEHDRTLGLLREASKKRGLGYLLNARVSEEDKELWPDEYASQGDIPHDGFMLSVLFPQLGPMRQMAKLLVFDAKQAAYEGDANRCLQDITSMLQIGKHLREHPILISDLVSFSIYSMTFSTIGEIVEHNQTLFSNEQFETLERSLAELDGYMTIRLAGERYFMLNLLQRMYTDDGDGDGSIVTLEASRMIEVTQSVLSGSTSLVPSLLTPFADLFHASRKEMLDEYTVRMDKTEAVIGIPLYELRKKPELLDAEEYPADSIIDPYFLVSLLMPALEKAMLQGEYIRGHRDALLAVLFAVQRHNVTGKWPEDLTDAGVLDAWSGEPLLLKLVSGEPVIYSVGYDLEDDGGVPDKRAPRWDESFVNDWVVWPSVE